MPQRLTHTIHIVTGKLNCYISYNLNLQSLVDGVLDARVVAEFVMQTYVKEGKELRRKAGG
jgi:hypothetical protein